VTRAFLENFSGDQVRFLANGTHSPGDHHGQMTTGYRWPFGPVALVCPFNFPLEIPVLQLMGALFMGNKVLLKPDQRVSMVMEQFLRMMHYCGAPMEDVDLLQAEGPIANELIQRAPFRLTQFTGSSTVAEHLASQNGGRVRLEDAGFDWKILGPDVHDVEYVAWQADQDAYACTGQKCSAQSIMFVHQNWLDQANLYERLSDIVQRRSLRNLTVGPLLSVTTQRFMDHIDSLLAIPGARVLWGGKPLKVCCFVVVVVLFCFVFLYMYMCCVYVYMFVCLFFSTFLY
jgi:1-pyrroline-5-carboxylate dehydrogenase